MVKSVSLFVVPLGVAEPVNDVKWGPPVLQHVTRVGVGGILWSKQQSQSLTARGLSAGKIFHSWNPFRFQSYIAAIESSPRRKSLSLDGDSGFAPCQGTPFHQDRRKLKPAPQLDSGMTAPPWSLLNFPRKGRIMTQVQNEHVSHLTSFNQRGNQVDVPAGSKANSQEERPISRPGILKWMSGKRRQLAPWTGGVGVD